MAPVDALDGRVGVAVVDGGAVSRALADAYGLAGVRLARVLSGVATVNFLADTRDGRRVFVKAYQPETDLAMERSAIELSEFAGAGGVPTARVVRTAGGDVVHEDERVAVSVWDFVVGDSAEGVGMDSSQMLAAGTVVGCMHRVLSTHPEARSRQETGTLCDVGKAMKKIDRALGVLSGGTALGPEFQAWAAEVLMWRRGLMPRVAAMLERLPPLTTQVVHGDLAMPNVLFHAGKVAAVIDFRPPSARPVAWEISRLGCDPCTVLRGDEWEQALPGLLAAYREENPVLPDEDLVATVRAWACYSAASIYPFDDLVDGRALLPESLQRYAMQRHHALISVLDRVEEIEAAVRKVLRRSVSRRS